MARPDKLSSMNTDRLITSHCKQILRDHVGNDVIYHANLSTTIMPTSSSATKAAEKIIIILNNTGATFDFSMLQLPCCARHTGTFEHVNHAYVMLSLPCAWRTWLQHAHIWLTIFYQSDAADTTFCAYYSMFWNVHAYTD